MCEGTLWLCGRVKGEKKRTDFSCQEKGVLPIGRGRDLLYKGVNILGTRGGKGRNKCRRGGGAFSYYSEKEKTGVFRCHKKGGNKKT